MSDPTTLASLLTPQTPAQYEANILAQLQALGFPVSSWQSGGVALSLIKTEEVALSAVDYAVSSLAGMGFPSIATGAWLDLLATNRYQLARAPAGSAVEMVALTCAAGVASQVKGAGEITVSTAGGQYQYVNDGPISLAGSTVVASTFTAVAAGSAFNASDGTITVLNTSIPGVTVGNPHRSASPYLPALISPGTDPESDASLAARCVQRFATLGTGATTQVYTQWAIAASPAQVRRVGVAPTDGTGIVTITLASDTGQVSAQAVTDAQSYIDARTPDCVEAIVQNVAPHGIAPTGVVRCLPGYSSSTGLAAGAIAAAFVRYSTGLAIGGESMGPEGLSPSTTGVPLARLIQLIEGQIGVANVTLTTPTADTVLASNELPAFDLSGLTYVSV